MNSPAAEVPTDRLSERRTNVCKTPGCGQEYQAFCYFEEGRWHFKNYYCQPCSKKRGEWLDSPADLAWVCTECLRPYHPTNRETRKPGRKRHICLPCRPAFMARKGQRVDRTLPCVEPGCEGLRINLRGLCSDHEKERHNRVFVKAYLKTRPPTVTWTCETCGKSYHPMRHALYYRRKHRFCSMICSKTLTKKACAAPVAGGCTRMRTRDHEYCRLHLKRSKSGKPLRALSRAITESEKANLLFLISMAPPRGRRWVTPDGQNACREVGRLYEAGVTLEEMSSILGTSRENIRLMIKRIGSTRRGRTWTPEQRAVQSAMMRERYERKRIRREAGIKAWATRKAALSG